MKKKNHSTMKRLAIYLLMLLCITGVSAQGPLTLADINIRDPFIYADAATKTYYMYSSATGATIDPSSRSVRGGVIVYKSKDLKHWSEAKTVMTLPDDNWITGKVWAPEMHAYKGKYYLFATINTHLVWKGGKNNGVPYTYRGTQIFHADSPEGPFHAFEDKMPATPIDEMALDGTLWEEDGQPYLIYCHEWVEVNDGAIKIRPLEKDLSKPTGAPTRLFCASAAEWVTKKETMVTDGCFLYRNAAGKLLMIWSSFTEQGYAVGYARSTTGKLLGPWEHQQEPFYRKHGGHAMIFKSFDNKLHMILHAPNSPGGAERAVIIDIEDTEDGIRATRP